MPLDLKAYRVFLASPGGLDDIRDAFRNVLEEFNDSDAIHRGALYIPVLGESTLSGRGRPQQLINRDIRTCDYFVLALWNRWGSSPDPVLDAFTAATEEEFHVALSCCTDEQLPMRELVMFFKEVDPAQMSDPGDQLKKVIEFRTRIEREKEHLISTFDTTEHFRSALRKHLSAWLRDHEHRFGHAGPETHSAGSTFIDWVNVPAPDAPSATDAEVGGLLERAEELLAEGNGTEAEAYFARAITKGSDPNAFLRYGQFLIREGRTAQAVAMLDRAVELSQQNWDVATEAYATNTLAEAHDAGGETRLAAECCERALALYEQIGSHEGMTSCYSRWGSILHREGDWDRAERMYFRSLAIEEKLARDDGLAIDYFNIGQVRHSRGDWNGAETMLLEALKFYGRVEDRPGLARTRIALAGVYRGKGDLERAEAMAREALDIVIQLDDHWGIADYSNEMGVIYDELQRMDEARSMYEQALAWNQFLGRSEDAAQNARNLAGVLASQGDFEAARAHYLSASEYYTQLGAADLVAEVMAQVRLLS